MSQTLFQSPYAVPTSIGKLTPEEATTYKPLYQALKPIYTKDMAEAYARGTSFASLFAALSDGGGKPTDANMGVVVDLPGPAAVAFAVLSGPALAQGQRRAKAGLLQEDFPFQAACIGANFPSNNVAMKGLALRVAPGDIANVLFDTDLLRMAAGWTGGYISSKGVAFDGGHGSHPGIVGEQACNRS